MADTTTSAVFTATATLKLKSALGNVRNRAKSIGSGVKGKQADPETAYAIHNLQDQLDQLISALETDLQVNVQQVDTTPTDGSARIAACYPWATVDPPTPIASLEVLRNPNFGLKQRILHDIKGLVTPQFLVSGRGIVNVFSDVTKAPVITLSTTATGGTLPGGVIYSVMVWAVDSDGNWTAGTLKSIQVPTDTNTNTVSVTVTFNDPANDSGMVAISPLPAAGWYGPGTTAIAVGNTAYTFTSIGDLNTTVPDENFDHFLVQARTAYKLGTGTRISAVSSGTVTMPGLGLGSNVLVGRTLNVYSLLDPTNPLPICDVPITGNSGDDITTGENLAALISPGDAVLFTMKATAATPTSITDAVLGTGGCPALVANAHVGQLLFIIRGTGVGTNPVTVVSNTGDTVVTSQFEVTPDTTTEYIIVGPVIDYQYSSGTLRFSALTQDAGVVLPLTVGNEWKHFFIQALTATVDGKASDMRWSPYRWIFQPGFDDQAGGGPPDYEFTVGFGTGGSPADIPVDPGDHLTGTSELLTVFMKGQIYRTQIECEQGPTGADLIMDILCYKGSSSPVTSFPGTTPITVPAGTSDRQQVTAADIQDGTLKYDAGDQIQLSVTQVGSTLPGQRAKVYLWVKDFDIVVQ